MYMYLIDILQFAIDNAGNGTNFITLNKTYKPLKFNCYEFKIRRFGPKL
jgi:hypothetical protein